MGRLNESRVVRFWLLVAGFGILLSAPCAVAAPNPAYNTVIATVAVGSGPFGLGVTPDGTEVWVALTGGSGGGGQTVQTIDAASNTAGPAIVTPGTGPIGVAMTPDGTRIYVTNSRSDTVTAIDRSNRSVLASIPVSRDPRFIAINPTGTKAYVANSGNTSGNTVSVITIPGHIVTSLVVGTQPIGVALTPDGARVYVTNCGDATVSVVDTTSDAVIRTITGLGHCPAGIAMTADGTRAYVVNGVANSISVIDTASDMVTATFAVGQVNYGIAITPDGTRAYVPMAGLDAVAVVDLGSQTIAATISTGSGSAPSNIAIHPSGTRAYTGNESNATVSVIDTAQFSDQLIATKDSFVRSGADNTNEGANPRLRIQSSGHNRVVLEFDLSGVVPADVTRASLTLTIADNADNWGPGGDRTVEAHPLLVGFAEGNGKSVGVPNQEATRGSGSGVTWNCATDTNITNQRADCSPSWNGGVYGVATAPPVLHVNGLTGPVSWDVTADVRAGVTRWLIKKTHEGASGKVEYFSREGAAEEGNPALAPRLLVE